MTFLLMIAANCNAFYATFVASIKTVENQNHLFFVFNWIEKSLCFLLSKSLFLKIWSIIKKK